MFVRVKRSVSKNSTSYSIIKDVYRNGKKTSKVVEALGNDEDILRKHPGVDPYTWAKEYAKKLTQEEKENSYKIIASYSPTKQIQLNKQTLFNTGYLFLQSIYHVLKLCKLAYYSRSSILNLFSCLSEVMCYYFHFISYVKKNMHAISLLFQEKKMPFKRHLLLSLI